MENIIYSNQANKIFIYNSAKDVNSRIKDEHIEPENTSSITILTSGIPEYHIRIKNNFKTKLEDFDEGAVTESKTYADEPPSTTKDTKHSEDFSLNDDVLISVDDKLYLGTIVRIQDGKYLVKFDDNTEKWSTGRGLKKLSSSTSKDEDGGEPLCVLCKKRKQADVVEVCTRCARGYHRHCQSPSNYSSPWCCDRCTASEVISISDSEDNESDVVVLKTLPYDLKSLKWDARHTENKEQTYCYCGKDGSWKIQMLQCCKCDQWFHQKCVSAWRGYFAHGDTFFVFRCKNCNDGGEEFLRRLSIDWKTAVHIALYDLSITCPKKFYSISSEIAPFMWDNWDRLNFPLIKYHSKERLSKKVQQTVKQENEFKLIGGNNKQKGDMVCLRKLVPLSRPKMRRPPDGVLNEKLLKKLGIKTFPLNEEPNVIRNTKPNELVKEKRRKRSSKVSIDVEQSIPTVNDDSSDETSSKSALDFIIPPPSNFHGTNNPFHDQYRSNTKFKFVKSNKRGQQFEKQQELRIVRTIKRRLSAKDIALASNKETKRRKIMKRRKSSNVEIISEILQPVSMPLPTYIPVRGSDSIEYKMSARDSGFFHDFNSDSKRNSAVQASLIEATEKINLTDAVMNSPVKNKSINLYFGALNRVQNGEKFTILAKRLTFDGKEQYLLDWDTINGNAAGCSNVKNEL